MKFFYICILATFTVFFGGNAQAIYIVDKSLTEDNGLHQTNEGLLGNYIIDKNNIALAITSDPQYPWVSNFDNKSSNEIKAESEALIREQYNSINKNLQATNAGTRHTIINGDITAYGHDWQWNKMNKTLLPILGGAKDYSYILGNHDIENNRYDCGLWPITSNDECYERSMENYYQHTRNKNFVDISFTHGFLRTSKTAYKGSFGYVNNFGGLYSIHINNFPTMEASSKDGVYSQVTNFVWLEKRLAEARQANKMIIINMHKPDSWDGGPSETFKNLLKKYEVSAIFAGHYHYQFGIQEGYQNYFGDTPVFLSGSADQRTYLMAQYHDGVLDIYKVENNGNPVFYQTIKTEATLTGSTYGYENVKENLTVTGYNRTFPATWSTKPGQVTNVSFVMTNSLGEIIFQRNNVPTNGDGVLTLDIPGPGKVGEYTLVASSKDFPESAKLNITYQAANLNGGGCSGGNPWCQMGPRMEP